MLNDETKAIFRLRRQRMMQALGPDSVAVVQSAQHSIRNHDVEHEWRQDSDFWYLTGFDEPGSVLVVKGDQATVFVRPRDPEQETWNGRRAGVERAAAWLGVEQAFDVGKFDEELGKLCEGCAQVALLLGRDPAFDQRVIKAARRHRTLPRLHLIGPDRYIDLTAVLSELRIRKTELEQAVLAQAGRVTADAHHEAMRICRPGLGERHLQAAVEYVFRANGSDRVGYGSIVARGDNATILHYRENNAQIRDGDLVLIDAGAECDYLTADVTRTFPANGRFSEPQRQVYAIVLDAEKQCIAMCTPQHTILQVHEHALKVLTQGLVQLGVLTGDVAELVKTEAYKPWYMHRTSHWLGMDVHDTGKYHELAGQGTQSRHLEPGFVLTVEPGLYFAADDARIPEQLRGIGVRIEDDVLVTAGEPVVLTAACAKEIADIEAMVGSGGQYVRGERLG